MNTWWVYIIQCRNTSLYTGITTDVERRFDEHQNNNRKASKYCARLRPLKLVYKSSAYENKSDASKEEYRIKKLSRKDKLYLIETNL
jgi:putative endonuclease